MGRRLKASNGNGTRTYKFEVVLTKAHPHYILCAKCKGKDKHKFYRREDWEAHMRKVHGGSRA